MEETVTRISLGLNENSSVAVQNETDLKFFNSTQPRGQIHNTECTYDLNEYDFMRMGVYVFGIVVNACLLMALKSSKNLRTVTFVIISNLGLTDLLFMASSLTYSLVFVGFINRETFSFSTKCHWLITNGILDTIVSIIISFTYTNSCLHIGLLAVARFIILVKPLWARQNLDKKAVHIMSLAVWIFSAVLCAMPSLFDVTGMSNARSISQVIVWTVSYPLVVCLTVVLHLIKVYNLRTTSISSQTLGFRRMNVFAGIVMSAFVVFPLPWNVLMFMYFFNKEIPITHTMWSITGIILILNNCSNPLIFGFMSDRCQKALMAICCPKPRLRNSSEGTSMSQQSIAFSVSLSSVNTTR